MAKSPNWTEEEISILITNYPKLGTSRDMEDLLPGRSSKGIQVKATRIGLKVSNPWNKLKTTEQYSSEILPQGIIVLEKYINDATKLNHKCISCEHTWESKPNNILNGSGCPICNRGFGSRYATENTYPEIAYIYLLKIRTKEEEFLKVGITTVPTNRRVWQISSEIGEDLVSCDIIKKIQSSGRLITLTEGKILKDPTLVKHTTNIPFKGRTELFHTSEEDKILDMLYSYLDYYA